MQRPGLFKIASSSWEMSRGIISQTHVLPNYRERVTLVKSTDAGKEGVPQLIIEHTADGQSRTVSQGDLSDGVEVKVDVLVSWTGKDGRHRERSYASIISDSGISRTNVQGFGGPTGAPPVENGGSDSSPTESEPSGESPTTGTQPVEIVEKSRGNDNDNGNGNSGSSDNGNPHGNTNQNPGKK
jgi:hypothetical protein